MGIAQHTLFGQLENLDLRLYSVIILDLSLPGMDGVEIMRVLQERAVTANIIVLSGVGDRVRRTSVRLGEERGLRMAGIWRSPFLLKQSRCYCGIAGQGLEWHWTPLPESHAVQ